jgi:hypothetical protein
MTAEKYSASMDDGLLSEARAAAEASGVTLSSWLADAVSDRLRLVALGALVSEWEAEHGAITTAEMDALDHKVAEARRRASERATRRRSSTSRESARHEAREARISETTKGARQAAS